MKMLNILAQHPIKATAASLGGAGVSTIEALTPPLQFAVAVGSLIIVCLTIIIKLRDLIRGSK
jgi:hypothetical protein